MIAPMPLTAQPPRAITLPPPRWVGAAAVVLATVAIASGLTFDAARTWSDLLVDGFFVLARRWEGSSSSRFIISRALRGRPACAASARR